MALVGKQQEESAVARRHELPARLVGKDGREETGTLRLEVPAAARGLTLTITEAASRASVAESMVHATLRGGELASLAIGRMRRSPADRLGGLLASPGTAPASLTEPE